jgi:hypothetical protein
LARIIKVDPKKFKEQEQVALSEFATMLSLVPDLDRWSSDDKAALRHIVAAKSARTEQRYQQLLQKHARLRTAILRLGS